MKYCTRCVMPETRPDVSNQRRCFFGYGFEEMKRMEEKLNIVSK